MRIRRARIASTQAISPGRAWRPVSAVTAEGIASSYLGPVSATRRVDPYRASAAKSAKPRIVRDPSARAAAAPAKHRGRIADTAGTPEVLPATADSAARPSGRSIELPRLGLGIILKTIVGKGKNYYMASRHFCACHSSGRRVRRVSISTVSSAGRRPCAISSTIGGARNANRMRRRRSSCTMCLRFASSPNCTQTYE